MPEQHHWRRRKFGVKQTALAALGILGAVRGLSYIDPPAIPAGLRTLAQVPSLDFWAWAWVIIGALSIIGAFTSHYRIPFVPLMVITSLWASSYFAEWCMDFFVRGIDSRDYITAVSYAVQALLILAVIRLIDPSEVHAPGGDRDVD